MRKVLLKKWINAIENPNYDKTKSVYLNKESAFIKGTNCWSNDFMENGYFHCFAGTSEESFAIIEKENGEIVHYGNSEFKFNDNPDNLKRFEAACAILQGIMASPKEFTINETESTSTHGRNKVKLAYIMADELLKQNN